MAREPRSAEEALALARAHGRAALAELLAALRALADAAALAATGQPAAQRRGIGTLVGLLDDLRAELGGADGEAAPILAALAEALEEEIARWELRSRTDAEARAVLRAFLGLREVLFEFGVRPAPPPPERRPAAARRRRPARRRDAGGVQGVRLDG